ncbi:glycosyltransferase [Streptomyces sp. NPDC002004]
MIVKNESRVIERCLASVRDLVDHWVISDTGSTDGTQDLVRTALDGIPGKLHEEPWTDFGHNRTLTLAHARGTSDYLLLIDADMVVRREGPLPALTADSYLLRHVGDAECWVGRLVRSGIAWRYEGATHAYLTTDVPTTRARLGALAIEQIDDGRSRTDKLTRDARLLTAELERDPHRSRAVYHLARTMHALGDSRRAVELYERRAAMGGWPEEIYCSLLQAGVLRAADDDWPGAMDAFLRAWEARPQRLEACYELTARLRRMGRHHAAHAILSAVVDRAAPDDLLYVQPWVYRWGLLHEYSVTSYWTGSPDASLAACERLLTLQDLPDAYRSRTLAHRAFVLQRTGRASRTVCEPRVG